MRSLLETNKLAYQYCESTYDQLSEICAPLSNLNINYFAYTKILPDGRFLNLFNNLHFLQNWFFTSGGFGDLVTAFYKQPESKSYILAPYDSDSLQKDRTLSLLASYGITSSFYIFKRDTHGQLIGYYFYSTSNDPLFSSYYLINIPILEHFIKYFETNAQDLIAISDESRLANFYQPLTIPINLLENTLLISKIEQFLLETQLLNITLTGKKGEIKLTRRETECLYYLSQGKSMKEIGRTLDLSPKTIEFYLRNIKDKSGYPTRSELLTQYSKNSFDSR